MQHFGGKVHETTWGAIHPWPPVSTFDKQTQDAQILRGTVTKVYNLAFRRTGETTTTKNATLAVGTSEVKETFGSKAGYLSGKKSNDVLYKSTAIEVELADVCRASFANEIKPFLTKYRSGQQQLEHAHKDDGKSFTFFCSNKLIADLRSTTRSNVNDDILVAGDSVEFETFGISLFVNNQTFKITKADRSMQPKSQHAQSSLYHQKAVNVDEGIVSNIAALQQKNKTNQDQDQNQAGKKNPRQV